MPSSLKNKLNALKKAPKPVTVPVSKLRIIRTEYPLQSGIDALDQDGLLHMGWTGRRFAFEKTCFFDTETTGLSGGSGTVAFLAGVGFAENGVFVVEQYFMGDYSDEPEMLTQLHSRLSGFENIVTFNGKRFDLPLIRTRCLMNRMEDAIGDLSELDLLYPSRRLWKLRIGSCRLSCIEEKILGIHRDGDLPGSEVPERYFSYLKTGDAALIEDILIHNRQDIVTLGDLLVRLAADYGTPERVKDKTDLFSIGRSMERSGDLRTAGRVYRMAARPAPVVDVASLIGDRYAGEANYRLYLMYRRTGEYDKAREALIDMVERRQKGYLPFVALAKLDEHISKDYQAALAWAESALACAPSTETESLQRRIARLHAKIEREET